MKVACRSLKLATMLSFVLFIIAVQSVASLSEQNLPFQLQQTTEPGIASPRRLFSGPVSPVKRGIQNPLHSLIAVPVDETFEQSDISDKSKLDYTASRQSEISWKLCSAENLRANLYTDVKIRCEVWAPLGSTLLWYKDDQLKMKQEHDTVVGQKRMELEDVNGDRLTYDRFSARNKYEFHLVSLLYIECVQQEDQGIYELRIETPSGRRYKRSFLLKTVGSNAFFWDYYCIYRKEFHPRIVDYSRTVIGKRGQELYLPCRPREKNSLKNIWSKMDRELTEKDYIITDEGDLKIYNLTTLDQGMYTCELNHYMHDIKYDEIATYVKVSE